MAALEINTLRVYQESHLHVLSINTIETDKYDVDSLQFSYITLLMFLPLLGLGEPHFFSLYHYDLLEERVAVLYFRAGSILSLLFCCLSKH